MRAIIILARRNSKRQRNRNRTNVNHNRPTLQTTSVAATATAATTTNHSHMQSLSCIRNSKGNFTFLAHKEPLIRFAPRRLGGARVRA